jgi:hypothetical protein
MDGIVSLHEIMHHSHVAKHVGVILKLHFEKTYDKVDWDFLFSCYKVKVFFKKCVVGLDRSA